DFAGDGTPPRADPWLHRVAFLAAPQIAVSARAGLSARGRRSPSRPGAVRFRGSGTGSRTACRIAGLVAPNNRLPAFSRPGAYPRPPPPSPFLLFELSRDLPPAP